MLDAALGARAEEIARDVAARLASSERVRSAAASSLEQSRFPGQLAWRPASTAHGNAGLAVLFGHLDACFPDEGWDRAGARELACAARALEAGCVRGIGLFGGLSGAAFAAHASSRGGTRYRRLSAALDEALRAPTLALCAEVRAARGGMPFRDFDVISGLAGVGAYLLCRIGAPDVRRTLESVLGALVDMVVEDGAPRAHEPPRWHTPGRFLREERLRAQHPDGVLNCGLAHGIPGPLALLSLAKLEGVEIAGLEAAIDALVSWLLAHRESDARGAGWPDVAPLRSGAAPTPPSRAAWCYGTPGVARAVWLAGRALGRPAIGEQATAAMEAVVVMPAERRSLSSPTFCHGLAGLLAITLRFAADTGEERFRAGASALARELIDAYEPGSPLGYRSVEAPGRSVDDPGLLDGAAGVPLVLLAASRAVEPAWDRLFLLA
ncbi:MAG: lanthionine synthetase C family protein [Minicystis sp.]